MGAATEFDRKAYWDKVYKTKQPNEVSWYEPRPITSLEFIKQLDLPKSSRIFDNGGGDSHLVDSLLDLGYRDITVLDVSEEALAKTKKRLGKDASKIKWIIADEAYCNPGKKYDLWHDRAAFHFLTEENEIRNYVNTIKNCINPGGYFVVGTFSDKGPKKCSGLDVKQYSENLMTDLLKESFEKLSCLTTDHTTPFNTLQNFLFCAFRRKQANTSDKPTKQEITAFDPYQLMAALGKKIIHPGGKQSTIELYTMAKLQAHHTVLEIGCGVGTTGIEIVKKFGCDIVISDVDDKMIEKAERNINASGLHHKIKVKKADILHLPFEDKSFDVIIIEAVTMFVNREAAIKEVLRVCKPNGKVIEQEFIWRKKPTIAQRKIFEGEVCPGIKFDTAEDWISIYESHGFKRLDMVTGPFIMMSLAGFVKDEGIINTISIMGKALSRLPYIKKMTWLMSRIFKVKNSLGYIVFSMEKKS